MSPYAAGMTSNAETERDSDLDAVDLKASELAVAGVLLVAFLVELVHYTLTSTQKIYFQNQLKKEPSTAAALSSIFSMLCFFWCIPGGVLADAMGRYKTIIAAGSIYALGAVCVGISAIYELQSSLSWLFLLGSLVFIAMGSGGIKPNIPAFGADQVGESQGQKSFFSFFYFSISISLLVAYGFLANTTTEGIPGVVSPSGGYSFAYGAGAGCIILAVLIFVSFSRSFTILPGSGLEPIQLLLKYQYHSMWNGGGWRARLSFAGFLCLPCFYVVTVADTLLSAFVEKPAPEVHDPCVAPLSLAPPLLHNHDEGGVLTYIALALGAMACIFLVVANVKCNWVQELEQTSFGVKDACQTFAAIPLIIVVDVALGFCGNSMNIAFPSQACQMNLRLGSIQLNGVFFNLAEAVTNVVCTPIFVSCLYPLLARLKGTPVRLGQKIIAGLVMAAISNIAAAVLETLRKEAPYICGDDGFSECAPGYDADGAVTRGTRMKDISAFWIFIPYALFAIAEILIIPGMYSFAYEAAPLEVRSLLQAFNLFFACSVSNAFSAGVSKLLYPNDLDSGSLETYYLVNAALSAMGLGVYFLITRCKGHSDTEPAMEGPRERTGP